MLRFARRDELTLPVALMQMAVELSHCFRQDPAWVAPAVGVDDIGGDADSFDLAPAAGLGGLGDGERLFGCLGEALTFARFAG